MELAYVLMRSLTSC